MGLPTKVKNNEKGTSEVKNKAKMTKRVYNTYIK